VVVGWGGFFLLLGGGLAGVLRQKAGNARVRREGAPAEATVLRIKKTAMRVNRRHVMEFLLEVRRPGQAPYQVRMSSLARDWNVQVLHEGLLLKVHVNPNNPQHVVVLGPVVQQDLGKAFSNLMAQGAAAPAPRDPVKALSDLQRLVDEGLITQDEYASKRAEIIGRL
jgi:hypothetical protein